MEIQAALENKDIGFVKLGQTAKIKLEAFAFTRFGIIDGTVSGIFSDAVIDPGRGPIFRATIKPDRSSFLVGNQNWKPYSFGFFITPILRYKDEAIKER